MDGSRRSPRHMQPPTCQTQLSDGPTQAQEAAVRSRWTLVAAKRRQDEGDQGNLRVGAVHPRGTTSPFEFLGLARVPGQPVQPVQPSQVKLQTAKGRMTDNYECGGEEISCAHRKAVALVTLVALVGLQLLGGR
jgi:hypothetical protein